MASRTYIAIQQAAGFGKCGSLMQAELRNDHAVLLTAQCTLAEKELLVGLVLMWCLVDEAQIIELAVHPDFRRQGIGLSLMSEAMAEGIRSVPTPFV